MLDIRQFTDSFAVAPQIEVVDLEKVVALGFKSVINNRPDGEVHGQALSTDVEEKCRALGLEYVFQPVLSGMVTPDSVIEFSRLVKSLPSPVLAFCRSGTRCSILWVSGSEDMATLNDRLHKIADHGYLFDPASLPLAFIRE